MVQTLERPDTIDPAPSTIAATKGRLAIVGSVSFVDPLAWQKVGRIIIEEIEVYAPQRCVSGGAPGVDTRAREIAWWYGYRIEDGTFTEFLPENKRWEPNGFKARNILIAENCDRLVAIRCHASKTYGSGWTADFAEKIGKAVRREIL